MLCAAYFAGVPLFIRLCHEVRGENHLVSVINYSVRERENGSEGEQLKGIGSLLTPRGILGTELITSGSAALAKPLTWSALDSNEEMKDVNKII